MNKPASFNSLAIGERVLEVPLVQGGMGVGISMGELAGAVMSCGGMGTISAADPEAIRRVGHSTGRITAMNAAGWPAVWS